MKRLIKLFVLLLCLSKYCYGQDIRTDKKPIAFTSGFSTIVSDESNELDIYAGVLLERKNGWGYGFDFTRSAYTSESAKGIPPITEIENFEGAELPSGIEKRFPYSGKRDNRLYSLSPNVFKSFALNKKRSLSIFIMGGPSIIYSEDYEYTAKYSPASSCEFGGFCFPDSSGPSLDYMRSKENKKIVFGGFSKISLRYTFTRVVGVELSAYGNLNGVKSVYGLQFGVVLGRLF
ncbi:hypothetical protein SAMN04487910_1600 [Aquimarina amphilecti]|uniref:Outer membrane protein beta-barrel domain-containing protein n=1 Tax=Aquimarina amphilecti TaxID=1038014 RepID=A0A1H7M702_AQUAM|nr:hypothetical protein [Aquimarina amphilecti]SEL06387.1 hypothetical protein SAMN04487910_1600 [Aquimarina amphilecti]